MNKSAQDKSRWIKITLAFGCLLIAALLINYSWPAPAARPVVVNAYYYDQSTGRVFVDGGDLYPPVLPPSGDQHQGRPAGARAYIFTCDQCADYDGMTADEVVSAGGFIGYLEVYTDQTLQALESPAGSNRILQDFQLRQAGSRLVRRLQQSEWVDSDSAAGQNIRDISGACGGRPAKPCMP